MAYKKTIKVTLLILFIWEVLRLLASVTLNSIQADLNGIDLSMFSVYPYLPLINVIVLALIFLDQKEEKTLDDQRQRILDYLRLIEINHNKLTNEHLGGSVKGEGVLLSMSIHVVTICECEEQIFDDSKNDREKFEFGYKYMNEWGKRLSLVKKYFELVFMTFDTINCSQLKDTYLPVFGIYLSEETVKALACGVPGKIRKNKEFLEFLKTTDGSGLDRFMDYGDRVHTIIEKLNGIFDSFDDHPEFPFYKA